MDAKHYHTGTIQAIDLIEAYELDFCLGNAVKYISRAGRKEMPWKILRRRFGTSNGASNT